MKVATESDHISPYSIRQVNLTWTKRDIAADHRGLLLQLSESEQRSCFGRKACKSNCLTPSIFKED